MKFLKTRVLPLFLAVIISASVLVVPASANASFPDHMRDYESVDDWNATILGTASTTLNALASKFGWDATVEGVFWGLVNMRLDRCVGEVEYTELCQLAETFNFNFNVPVQESFLLQSVAGGIEMANDTLAFLTLGSFSPSFTVTYSVSDKCYRIIEEHTGNFVVNSAGCYPYALNIADDGEKTNKWIGEVTAEERLSVVEPVTLDKLNMTCNNLKKEGIPAQIKSIGSNYKCIWWNRQVLADSEGKPIVAWYDENQSAVNQDREPTTGNITENGDIIEGDFTDNSMKLDLSGMTMVLPDGTFQFIDKVIYDESTKSYHIDSHDTYNYEVNNYYTWNYYINYTSITYIGQTEEYNKYYEVYYELPDGRSSADITKEDLEQLNLSVDVIPYGRSADDTSLRSLYHFDGDTKDSSYWNYCTDFKWNKGASLTYMDAGVFNGALYLDETEHDFSFILPSNISTLDFTLQFRYYQSYTAAPQTDSYMKIGDTTFLQFNGGSFLNGSGTVLASTPVGSWNEIALIRSNGVVYYFVNGVCVGSVANAGSFADTINFYFGNSQQTFKYFDEFRFVNKALYGAGGYTPSSVPYDSNLTLVLPTDSVPVADEYWNFQNDQTPVWSAEMIDGLGSAFTTNNYIEYPTKLLQYHSGLTTVTPTPGFVSVNALANGTTINHGLRFDVINSTWNYSNFYDIYGSSGRYSPDSLTSYNKPFVFSLVDIDGNVYSFEFVAQFSADYEDRLYCSESFDWGTIELRSMAHNSNFHRLSVFVKPYVGKTLDLVYAELVQATSSNLKAEFVTSVTGIDKADLNTPTLAVRTDIDITSYQIGGVRPSLPEKGMVWAMVENERITSLQVYNGQAWEGVDGRIWTGERWIPMSSYNIITLQDLYDIVDATPNYEYIYSEAGFWAWWQKSWNAFTEKLFAALGSNGVGSGGATLNPDTAPVVPDDEATGEKGYSILELLVVLKDGTWSIVRGVVSTAYDGFSGLVTTVSNAGSFFDSYSEDSEGSLVFIPLEEGETIWD